MVTQSEYQRRAISQNSDYQKEKTCRSSFKFNGILLKVSGRADGVVLKAPQLVEEIKATRRNPKDVHDHVGMVHLAQLKLYAAMLAKTENFECCTVKLTYVHPDTFTTKSFQLELEEGELTNFFESTCQVYIKFLAKILTRIDRRNHFAKSQDFPFENVSEGQLRVARRTYVSIREGENLMLDAPTGTGKTVSTLFPSIKAMGEDVVDRVIFATTRTTGQRMPLDTLKLLQADNKDLTSISIIAKDRICFTPGATCAPEYCEFAKGHYDRVTDAREDLLARKTIDRKGIELVARAHTVCPYELSWSAALWADVVVMDYSYVFDPFVSMRRPDSKRFRREVLLLDEAHRLGDRVADMLSVELSDSMLEALIESRLDRTIEDLTSLLVQSLSELNHQYLTHDNEALVPDIPVEIWNLAVELVENLANLNFENIGDVVFQGYYQLSKFVASRSRFEEDSASYAWIISRENSSVTLHLRCLLPGPWIKKTLKTYNSSVRFSGTLTPPAVFEEQHGVVGPFVRAPVEVDRRRFGIMVVPDISTYFRDRVETAPGVAQLIRAVRDSCSMNWLVAFPSFEYLSLVHGKLSEFEGLRCQEQEMSISDRSEFIDWVNEGSQRIALVVMGGVFTESVDFDTSTLGGVIVVGPSLPPPNLERELISQQGELGFDLAYRLPALSRVVQAAGRVVRKLDDRGAVVLVDPRFTNSKITQYFPQHWSTTVVRSKDISRRLAEFWNS